MCVGYMCQTQKPQEEYNNLLYHFSSYFLETGSLTGSKSKLVVHHPQQSILLYSTQHHGSDRCRQPRLGRFFHLFLLVLLGLEFLFSFYCVYGCWDSNSDLCTYTASSLSNLGISHVGVEQCVLSEPPWPAVPAFCAAHNDLPVTPSSVITCVYGLCATSARQVPLTSQFSYRTVIYRVIPSPKGNISTLTSCLFLLRWTAPTTLSHVIDIIFPHICKFYIKC